MTDCRRLATLALLIALALAGRPAGAAEPVVDRHAQAEALFRKALARLERRNVDQRRLALRDLEQATLLDPTQPEYELTLARAYYQSGYLKSARMRFERVAALAPEDAGARFGLGQVWRRDWLKYLDPGSLDRALDNFSWSARLDPGHGDAWLMLSTLLIERKDLRNAAAAADRAFEAEPGRPEAQLAVAAARYRLGDVERADSLFRAAVPRLRRSVRERFEDIAPIATEQDTIALRRLEPVARPEFLRRFWKDRDPDLASPVNEAQLEYWTRISQAYFLFYDEKRREWDERGEVYVRYGPPEKADYNPVGTPLRVSLGQYGNFPANVLVWGYPSLGMTVVMQDRILSEYYLLPISMDRDMDPAPDPDSLAQRNALASAGGRGVFPLLPPGARPLPIEAEVARFEGGAGPRLFGELEVAGGPGDTRTGEWVVLDSARVEVARASRDLKPSACEAEQRRVADFATELPPGEYLIGFSARGGSDLRGSVRRTVRVEPRTAALALSDLVVSCGTPIITGPQVLIEPNPGARVAAGEALTAYFEVYRLTPDASGTSYFEYIYRVKSAMKDRRLWIQRAFQPRAALPNIEASRRESQPGSMRRQFVTVPVQSLPPGRFRLEITVRDLRSGEEAVRSIEFVRLPAVAVR